MSARFADWRRILMASVAVAAVAAVAVGTLAPACVREGLQGPAAERRREAMVTYQLEERGITGPAVLKAMRTVPRHRFVPSDLSDRAYDDGPLPIGEGQTISQPYIVAVMTQAIVPRKDMRVLEIGTGSGYQAAVLAECVGEVDTIEILPRLGRRAEAVLRSLGYENVRCRVGDGHQGWPERAPYDAIVLTAAPPEHVPRPLLDQLKIGGRLIAPVGQDAQELLRITRTESGWNREVLAAVRFVPMTGETGPMSD